MEIGRFEVQGVDRVCLETAKRRQTEVQAGGIHCRVIRLRRDVRPNDRQIPEVAPEHRCVGSGRGSTGAKHQVDGLPAEAYTLLLDLQEPAVLLFAEGNSLFGLAAGAT